MSRWSAGLRLLLGVATLAPVSPAVAGSGPSVRDLALPSATAALSPAPPLPNVGPITERRFPIGVASREQVATEVDAKGEPVSIRVVQRLDVHGKGDYFFSIPAPVIDVSSEAGSQSEPGQRENAILWQGFSPGRRRLASEAALRLRGSAEYLPLRLRLSLTESGVLLSIENITATSAQTFQGRGQPNELARLLDRLVRGESLAQSFATVTGPTQARVAHVGVPLEVRGELRVGGRSRSFARLLDSPAASRTTIRLAGSGLGGAKATFRLTATPLAARARPHPPGGGSWITAVRTGRVRTDGAGLLRELTDALLASGRFNQYQSFLANPDSTGPSSTSYVFRSAAEDAAPAVAPPGQGGSSNRTAIAVLVGLGVALAAAALVVLWAHL